MDISVFISQIRQLEDHECNARIKGYLSYHHEIRDGLNSILIYKCTSCTDERQIETNPVRNNEQNVNFLATWGAIMTGKGHTHLDESLAFLDVPCMSSKTFQKYQKLVGKVY